MKVVVSGLAGSGKNTVSEAIAEEFGLDFYCGGDMLKEIAREEGYDPTDNWWETEEGMKFVKEREDDHEFDKRLDNLLKGKLDQGDAVVTSRTMAWLYEGDSFNIWLKASRKERARRIAKRDGIRYEKALDKVKERDVENKKLYRDLYGFVIGEDLEPFDMIVETEELSIGEMKREIIKALKSEYKS